MSVLATQEELDQTALEHAHRVIMAPTKQKLGLLLVLRVQRGSFLRCWVLPRMCALATPERRDPTGFQRVQRVILEPTGQKRDLLRVTCVEPGNLRW